MQIKLIETEQDYEAALSVVAPMFDQEPSINTPEGDFFETICLLIEEYEKKHYPLNI
jgi:HTH-type transcriptional regulator/antitoxin HigA